MRCVFLTDISLVSTMRIWRVFQENTYRVLVHMYNHTGSLRLQSQHTSNLKSFCTSWSMLLIQAETDPNKILLAICEPYNLTIQDQEDKNSDRTDDRESVTRTSWMKLSLDKQSAATGTKAHHHKLQAQDSGSPSSCEEKRSGTIPQRHDTSRLLQRVKKASGAGRRHKMRVS